LGIRLIDILLVTIGLAWKWSIEVPSAADRRPTADALLARIKEKDRACLCIYIWLSPTKSAKRRRAFVHAKVWSPHSFRSV
jgi:hypothetical protein